jgi:Pectate lyase superfamily protein
MRSDAAPPLSQAIVPTWTGVHKHFGDVYFGSGRPWADVRSGANSCAAALGNNSNDDTSAIQCQITYMNSTYGGGTVLVPCGTYRITSRLQLSSGVRLVGQGAGCSTILGFYGGTRVGAVIEVSGTNTTLEDISLQHDTSSTCASGGTAVVVQIDAVVGTQIRNSYLQGATYALYILGGIDNYVANTFVGGGNSNSCASVFLQGTTASKFIGNKIDPPAGNAGYGVIIEANSGDGTTPKENIFIGNDISGYNLAAVLIDDSADATARTAITNLIGNVLGGNVQLNSFKYTTIIGGELGANVTGTLSGKAALSGVIGLGPGLTATGAACAANINITC